MSQTDETTEPNDEGASPTDTESEVTTDATDADSGTVESGGPADESDDTTSSGDVVEGDDDVIGNGCFGGFSCGFGCFRGGRFGCGRFGCRLRSGRASKYHSGYEQQRDHEQYDFLHCFLPPFNMPFGLFPFSGNLFFLIFFGTT